MVILTLSRNAHECICTVPLGNEKQFYDSDGVEVRDSKSTNSDECIAKFWRVKSFVAAFGCVGGFAYHEGATKEIEHESLSYHFWTEEHFASRTSSYIFKEGVLDKEEH